MLPTAHGLLEQAFILASRWQSVALGTRLGSCLGLFYKVGQLLYREVICNPRAILRLLIQTISICFEICYSCLADLVYGFESAPI